MPINLDPLLAHLPSWLLVLFRITGIFVIAPLLGARAIPARVRIFWAVALSLCVYPMLLSVGSPAAKLITPVVKNGLSLWTTVPAVATELLIGLIIGYGASLPLMGMQVSGRLVDQQLGMALGGVFNPDVDDQAGVIGQFYYLLALALFVILGGHRVMVGILVDSFNTIPLGGFWPDLHLLDLLVGLLGSMFSLAIRVAAPLLCLIFLETLAMGFIIRTVPQINILSIGFPLRIIIGIALLVGAIGITGQVYVQTMRQTLRTIGLYLGL